ncbi:MAG TPA: metalloregulator ArsR/SmtB family transcription factor [Rhodothermia bacterium]
MDNHDPFSAVSEPTRRAIIHLLADEKEGLTLTDLSAHFDVSRQAVTKHVYILRDAGLVSMAKRGREQICSAELRNLKTIYEWVSVYKQFWTEKLDALGTYLDDRRRDES